MVYSLLVFHWRPVTVYFYLKGIVSTTLTPVVTASLTLPLRGTREPLLNRVLIIIKAIKNYQVKNIEVNLLTLLSVFVSVLFNHMLVEIISLSVLVVTYFTLRMKAYKIKDHRVNYTTGRNLCNGRNLVELVAVNIITSIQI